MAIKNYPDYFEAKKRRNELMEQDKINKLTEVELLELGELVRDIEMFKDVIMNFD